VGPKHGFTVIIVHPAAAHQCLIKEVFALPQAVSVDPLEICLTPCHGVYFIKRNTLACGVFVEHPNSFAEKGNTMRLHRRVILSLCLAAIAASSSVLARTISKTEAETAVKGWLNIDEMPMDEWVGWEIEWTDTYYDADGNYAYYVVYLKPEGYVIVSASDLVEPIVGFTTGLAYYDPSPDNVLGALVSKDLPSRIKTAEAVEQKLNRQQNAALSTQEIYAKISSVRATIKWRQLKAGAATPFTGALSISDVRVSPLVTSTWGQDNVAGSNCYNYYTPNHYYDGCVATAMAQAMRYYQWPAAGVGVASFGIWIDSVFSTASTHGGNGAGGAYNWVQMPLSPSGSMTETQRQAIGALCYDAGVASHMQYSGSGSGAYMHDAKAALVTTFQYSNAVMGGNEWSNIGAGLNNMINPNLDAGYPVLLAIYSQSAGHALVADGYGYNASTLYHHLNLGWEGIADAWYNLPNVNTGYYMFNTVVACIYNIYTSGSGEIISGRVTNSDGQPFAGATVRAVYSGGTYTATSNSNGIYAFAKVLANTTYTVTASAAGKTFNGSQTVTTGRSQDAQISTGNKGGIDFSVVIPAPAAPASITYPASSMTGKYTVSWAACTGATSYVLTRSSNSGASWQQVYTGATVSYSEIIGNGNYRYAVQAVNSGGASKLKTGTVDCSVCTTPPAIPSTVSYPATSKTGKYTVTWPASAKATSYVLRRSKNGGLTWTDTYSGAVNSYSENIGSGTYRYSVKAVNPVGCSSWRTGTSSCIVKK
jgi:hypothetical protein